MKKPAQRKNTFSILVIVLFFLIIGVIVLNSQKSRINEQRPQITTNQIKTFQSKNLKFSISLKPDYKINEKAGRIELLNSGGVINIDRNGTNFDNLKEYLNDLDKRNRVEIVKEEYKTINNYSTVFRKLKFPSGEIQQGYTLFIDNWVYNIYSNVESLFTNLDQIVQSFRYTP